MTPKRVLKILFSLFQQPENSISDTTTIQKVAELEPNFLKWLSDKSYLRECDDRSLTLKQFTTEKHLPTPSVLYMQFQLEVLVPPVRSLPVSDLCGFFAKHPSAKLLDLRDRWEREIVTIPNSISVDEALVHEITGNWSRKTPIVAYCHYGIRSRDFVTYLNGAGFEEVFCLEGGIAAWSEIKYEGHCA